MAIWVLLLFLHLQCISKNQFINSEWEKTDEICETFFFFIIIYLSKIECKLKCTWNEEAVVVLTCYIKLHNYTRTGSRLDMSTS